MSDNDKSAIGDLALDLDGDGVVRVRNLNSSRGIVASVERIASKNFLLRSPQSDRTIPFSPRSFEIRIPAGLRKRVGFDHFTRPLDNLGEEHIGLEYRIAGARYVSDEPIPLPDPSLVPDYLFLVTWQGGQTAYHFINLNAEFGIDCELRPDPPHGQSSHLRLEPNQHMDNWAGQAGLHFSLIRPNFFTVPGD